MKSTTMLKRFALLVCFFLFSFQNSTAQCFQIESILVDACGAQEGLNEMVRFKVGNTAINTSNLNVVWPNNPWEGLVQNATTAAKVASLNADILDAGGCGQLIEPTGGVLPANATVILVTSFNLDTALNSFGALTETIYIIFQDNPNTTSGHFANSGTGIRTLAMSFGACSDTVSYNRALLMDTFGATVPADGAIVLFNPAGTPTYINNGCSAPVPPFTVDAGLPTINACAGATIALNGSAQGQQTVQWSAASGTFSNSGNLVTNYTIDAGASGNIQLTLTITNTCDATLTDTVAVNISNSTVPNFTTALTLCSGTPAPTLNATSPNGISGTWNPATISNTVSGNYVFTPIPGQCANSITLVVTITNANIIPNFATTLTLCSGTAAPTLNATSPNGISGTWNPATINNMANGSYIFTPNPGQCASITTLNVTVTNSTIPDFATALGFCSGSVAPILNATSPNGIVGTWNPATINNMANGSYIFTPNPGQCASITTLNVTVTNSTIPDFATTLSLCNGATAPVLDATSPNGITGTWNPATISNTANGNYIFTPNPGQCAQNTTLSVTIESLDFDIAQGCSDGKYLLSPTLSENQDADFEWVDGLGNTVGNEPGLNVTDLINTTPANEPFPLVYQLTVTSSAGCSETKSVTVDSILCTIQKGISPNGDHLNDTFDLSGFGVTDLAIFNRYGMKVYTKRNYTDEWQGQTDKGDELPDGTYYYVISFGSGNPATGWIYVSKVR